MTKDEALKMCLEYIETDAHERRYVRHAIKEALAQPAQELDACCECGKKKSDGWALYCVDCIDEMHTATAQPAQEPVAWGYRNNAGAIYDCISPEAHADEEGDYDVPLYTTPPKREWVGLTDEETSGYTQHEMTVVKYVSKVLQEKNT